MIGQRFEWLPTFRCCVVYSGITAHLRPSTTWMALHMVNNTIPWQMRFGTSISSWIAMAIHLTALSHKAQLLYWAIHHLAIVLIQQYAWLNLQDKHMTDGRINQISLPHSKPRNCQIRGRSMKPMPSAGSTVTCGYSMKCNAYTLS